MEQNKTNGQDTISMPRAERANAIPAGVAGETTMVESVVETKEAAAVEGPATEAVAAMESVETPAAVTSTSVAGTSSEQSSKTKRNSQWMPVAMVLCVLLAIGGVGFGIWAMMDGNAKVDAQNAQIDSLSDQNAELKEQVDLLIAVNTDNHEDAENHDYHETHEARYWASTDLKDGVFYVLDANGNTLAQSNVDSLVVNQIVSCEPSAENTILTCNVSTSEGEGWFLYDVYGDSLASSFESE